MKADFYAVQMEVDGFGNDTVTLAVFKTEAEALAYVEECKEEDEEYQKRLENASDNERFLGGYGRKSNYEVVPQKWGEYENYW